MQFLHFRFTIKSVAMFYNLGHETCTLPPMPTGINASAYDMTMIAPGTCILVFQFTCLCHIEAGKRNATLHIAIGPFVKMTFESRPSCGENWPICGNGIRNRSSCGNRPSCGNWPIWGNRPSCESYIYIQYHVRQDLTVSF